MSAIASQVPPSAVVPGFRDRLLSLDLLRGLTMGFMILVNDNGSERDAYWPLKHAVWNGFTPTDLVFPTFLFLVGISTVLSTQARLAKGATRASLLLHTARRAAILFLLGLIINSSPFFHLDTLRVYGVLQRIAVCYFIVAALYIASPRWRSKVVLLAGVLVGYWALMRFVPVPGYGVPGHGIPLLDPVANPVAWLDRQFFSPKHLYEGTRDPEGLLSTLPAIGTALIGMLTGIWLRSAHSLRVRIQGVVAAGVSGVLLGGLWNLSFPINKKLWTSSYVLFAGGLSLLLLALFLWLADARGAKSKAAKPSPLATFLLVFGTNAITGYFFSEILAGMVDAFTLPDHKSIGEHLYLAIHSVIANAAFASLTYSLSFVGVCWLVLFVLYRKRIFLKI